MIVGIGADIVAIDRIGRSLDRHGRRFVERILTAAELADWDGTERPPITAVHYIAKRFAAKEATAKALGTGFRNGLSFNQIGIEHDRLGRPRLTLSGRARQQAEQAGVVTSHITLTDERAYAVAFVILTGGHSPD